MRRARLDARSTPGLMRDQTGGGRTVTDVHSPTLVHLESEPLPEAQLGSKIGLDRREDRLKGGHEC